MIELPPLPEKEFFSIGEVGQISQLPAYVLRYWESEFKLLKPQRRFSGQRKYTKKDIEQLFVIKDLLHVKKFTIAGAKRFLIDQKKKTSIPPEHVTLNFQSKENHAVKELKEYKEILLEAKKELESLLEALK